METHKEPKVKNEFEFCRMCAKKDEQSEFFKTIFPTLEKYNYEVTFGQPIGMHVYNAIVELFEDGCLKPFWDDYNRLKERVSELEKEKEIVKEWLGRGDNKAQNSPTETPRPQSFEDVFPPNPNGYWLL
jgi:hypothetical protein